MFLFLESKLMTWNDPYPTSKLQLRKPPSSSKLLVNNDAKRSTPHPTSKSQPRKLLLVQTWITTPSTHYHNSNTHWSHSHPYWLQTKHFGFDAGLNDRRHRLGSGYVSFFSSSNYYLGYELLMTVITRNEPRLHIPILPISSPSNGMWVFLFSVLRRWDLRGRKGVSEDLWRLYGGQVRTSLSL